MARRDEPNPFGVPIPGAGGLAGEIGGTGPTIVLLHGLTATRRYVVQGSSHLARHGHRIVAYDARGHGDSSPGPSPDGYKYADLVADLERLLDDLELERCVLAGSSMGAATALAFTLQSPERVDALVQITPASLGGPTADADELAAWDRLAAGLREDGVQGFLDAYDPPISGEWRKTVMTATRQRLEAHRDLVAVADAVEVVPRSSAFERGLDALESVEAPVLVVGSRDATDPGHPLEVAEAYIERLPRAELAIEDEDDSPLAWQGARLSREIAAFLARSLPQ